MSTTTDIKRQDDRILHTLAAAVVVLIAAGLGAYTMWTHDIRFGGMAMLLFDLDTEQNIPTWFSSVLLAFLALTAWRLIPTHATKMTRFAHMALAAGFLFLSADEAALLHERVGSMVDVGGAFANARWIIVWLPVMGIIGLALLAVLWKSSPRLVLGLIVGAVVFLTGAVGVESFNQLNRHNEVARLKAAEIEPQSTRKFSQNDDRYGNNTASYAIGTAAEEGLEKFGLVIWCGVLFAARRRAEAQATLPIEQAHARTGAQPARPTKPAHAEPKPRLASHATF